MSGKHDDQYFAALGRMVDSFAHAEYAAFYFLMKRTGLDPTAAAAIFGALGANATIDTIRRLYSNRSQPLPAPLGSTLKQLEAITAARNAALHHGTYTDAKGNMVASKWTVTFGKPLKEHSVSIANLDAMREDLAAIMTILMTENDDELAGLAGSASASRHYRAALESAWLYKS
ncbi:hypothetical protein [Henriciella sp.]|uniref:hypothetical protein n=1 Tax=Henriciella sp. TaxID=1968823 RepID=UPI00262471B2|nr:hypothetical protein [Henriciella sp.]